MDDIWVMFIADVDGGLLWAIVTSGNALRETDAHGETKSSEVRDGA